MPSEGWTYGVLPVDIDPKKHIHRHKTKKNARNEHESTGEYDKFAYPYFDLSFHTHANPLCALWHAGVELKRLSRTRVMEILDKLMLMGEEGEELANSIGDILRLHKAWILRGAGHSEVQQTAAEIHYQDTKTVEFPQVASSLDNEVDDWEEPTSVFPSGAAPEDASDSYSVPNTVFDELTIHDSSSAPATDSASAVTQEAISSRSKKRKKPSMSTSPSTNFGLPVPDDSPTQHVAKNRKTVHNGGVQVTASTERMKALPLQLASQSERGTKSTKEPGEQPVPAPLLPPKTKYQRTGLGSGRGELSGAGHDGHYLARKAASGSKGKERASSQSGHKAFERARSSSVKSHQTGSHVGKIDPSRGTGRSVPASVVTPRMEELNQLLMSKKAGPSNSGTRATPAPSDASGSGSRQRTGSNSTAGTACPSDSGNQPSTSRFGGDSASGTASVPSTRLTSGSKQTSPPKTLKPAWKP
ncbi:hypothetical protein B0H12DRAFT_55309 [Mycena haematopus]|nr:hypothetical protein B0H12DRAFT_55309 [Mycena haematopus]